LVMAAAVIKGKGEKEKQSVKGEEFRNSGQK
jgi:hypothetical protein